MEKLYDKVKEEETEQKEYFKLHFKQLQLHEKDEAASHVLEDYLKNDDRKALNDDSSHSMRSIWMLEFIEKSG